MLHLLPIAIVLAGGYYLIRLRAFFLLHPLRTLSLALREGREEGKGALLRLSLALAGTLGVGNVTGVAAGIVIGGAGSVFWILVSAIFCAPLKYAESVVAISAKKKGESRGFITLVRGSFSHMGAPLSVLYALLCVGLAFFMGSALQSAAVSEAASALGSRALARICVLSFVLLLAICVIGRSDKIARATVVLIPIALIIYTIICIISVFSGISRLGEVVHLVIFDAFSPRAFVGGTAGYALASPLREGFLRGLLSNEAGAGTSAFAHTKNEKSTPFFEGVLGMAEILFDTVILCMLTAFAILLSVEDLGAYKSGMDILRAAFGGVLGEGYVLPLLLSVFLFAVGGAVCWYEYGRCALTSLRVPCGALYTAVYLAFSLCGAYLGSMALIPICDAFLFFLAMIALPTLIKNSAAVCAVTRRALREGSDRTAARGGS